MSPGAPLLRMEDLVLRFGAQAALNHVTLSIDHGEILGLIGPNGSGKTCILNVVTGVYRAESGRVLLGDQDLSGSRPHVVARSGVARTFQSGELLPGLTVLENVLLGCEQLWRSGTLRVLARSPLARREERDFRARAVEALDLVGLADLAAEPGESLPWAQRKLVEIARAVVAEPKLLLLDEPMSGMNAAEKTELLSVVESLRAKRGIGVVLIEHDVPVMRRIADRLAVLSFGEIVAEGPPAEVLKSDVVRAAYLGQ